MVSLLISPLNSLSNLYDRDNIQNIIHFTKFEIFVIYIHVYLRYIYAKYMGIKYHNIIRSLSDYKQKHTYPKKRPKALQCHLKYFMRAKGKDQIPFSILVK